MWEAIVDISELVSVTGIMFEVKIMFWEASCQDTFSSVERGESKCGRDIVERFMTPLYR